MICLKDPDGQELNLHLAHAERMPFLSGEKNHPHKHKHLQHVIYYQSGRGKILFEGQWHEALPGDFWIIDAGEEHSFAAAARDPHVYLEATFQITPHRPLTRLIRNLSHVNKAWRNPFQPAAHFREDIVGLLGSLAQLSRGEQILGKAFESLRISELILSLAKAHQESQGSSAQESTIERVPGDTNRLVEETRMYLRKNYRRPLAMEELAAYLKCSVSTVAHVFKKSTRHSVGEELRRMRLIQAKKLLRISDYTIARIAESCGFGDAAHFSRFFKRMENKSPKEYRKTIENG